MSFKQQKNLSQSTAKIRQLHPTSWRVPSRGHYITNPNTPLFSGEILQTYPYFRIVSSPPQNGRYPFTDVTGPSHPSNPSKPPLAMQVPGCLAMHGDDVSTCLGEVLHTLLRLHNHQMAVQHCFWMSLPAKFKVRRRKGSHFGKV